MLNQNDQKQISERGICIEKFNSQLINFKTGFPFLTITDAATPARGIRQLSGTEQELAVKTAEQYEGTVYKFVPASGAATRMFKDLFEALTALEKGESLKENSPAHKFISNITRFPFFNPEHLLKLTLYPQAHNYGAKPKGLIEFHTYPDGNRTPFEEHLVEGALYARRKDGLVQLVVTVSEEHMEGFRTLLESVREKYEKRFDCRYDITFTTQSPATDIVAVDLENKPFRKDDGMLLFRPGGHGALLDNLNRIDADVIIIKNIDNVVKESLIGETIRWKKILSGRVLQLQEQIHTYLRELDKYPLGEVPVELTTRISDFLKQEFCIVFPVLPAEALVVELKKKLNRPIRVCGMVKNEGEPGGGPYIITAPDGTTSLQILEEAQINKSDGASLAAMKRATHFNPVDLVCAVKNYKGDKFNLADYSDPFTGFISAKSYEGRPLKAQELPGLWNGAMSNWNTQFVEVPLITFNPVKTVLDLLREQHC